mgnify:CR=1 FL=1
MVCVPVIFACVLGFIWTLPVPEAWIETVPWFNWSLVAIAVATVFYVWLSPALSAGMLFFMAGCYSSLVLLELFAPWPVWKIAAVAFVLAWIGQFIGHKIEGRKPSFFKDVIFLLIGPAWLMLSESWIARVSSTYMYLHAGRPASAWVSAALSPARLGHARLQACAASARGSRSRLARTSRCWVTLSASVVGADRGD